MNIRKRFLTITLVWISSLVVHAGTLGTGFTYQGRLQDATGAVDGRYDLRFVLYDSLNEGTQVGLALTNTAVGVTNGLFSTALDFGKGAFAGDARWLEVWVRPNGSGAFTKLSPRQPLTAAPYALMAAAAATVEATNLTGTMPDAVLSGNIPRLNGNPVFTGLAQFSQASGTFAGNGGGLTNLAAASLVGRVPEMSLPTNVALLSASQVFTGSNGFKGVVVLGNVSNSIAGQFSGNGSALTNLNPTNLTAGTAAINITGRAAAASSAESFSGALAGDVTGPQTATSVERIQSRPVAATAPATGQYLRFDGTHWAPANASLEAGFSGILQVTNGGTGSGTKNFVDLTGDQTIGGRKLFSPTSDAPGLVVRQTTANSPSADVFTVQNSLGTLAFLRVDSTGAVSWAGTALGAVGGDGSRMANLNAGALNSGTVPSGRLSGTYSNAVSLTNAANSFGGQFAGDGAGLVNVNADQLGGFQAADFWKTGGNAGTVPGTNFVGTTDNRALELKVNNERALRLEPNTTAPNVIEGSRSNFVAATAGGATIGGGGSATLPNTASANFSVVSGGSGNGVASTDGTISGGIRNTIQTNAAGSVIAGGGTNRIDGGSVLAVIGGGGANAIQASAGYAVIGGGVSNTVQTGSSNTVVSGGANNVIGANASYATVPGGQGAKADKYGQLAYAGGSFATAGDAQSGVYVLRGTSSGASWGELFLDGIAKRLTVPLNSTWTYQVLLVGRTSGGKAGGCRCWGVIQNQGGAVRLVPGPNPHYDALDVDDSHWSVWVGADDASDALFIKGQGAAGDTIRWVATVYTTEVKF